MNKEYKAKLNGREKILNSISENFSIDKICSVSAEFSDGSIFEGEFDFGEYESSTENHYSRITTKNGDVFETWIEEKLEN